LYDSSAIESEERHQNISKGVNWSHQIQEHYTPETSHGLPYRNLSSLMDARMHSEIHMKQIPWHTKSTTHLL